MQERSPKTGYERVYLHLFDIVMQTVELELFEKHLKRIGRRKPRWRSCGSLPRRDLVNASRNRNNKYRKKEHGKCRRRGNLKYKPEREREREKRWVPARHWKPVAAPAAAANGFIGLPLAQRLTVNYQRRKGNEPKATGENHNLPFVQIESQSKKKAAKENRGERVPLPFNFCFESFFNEQDLRSRFW